jgi:hypothetical protein
MIGVAGLRGLQGRFRCSALGLFRNHFWGASSTMCTGSRTAIRPVFDRIMLETDFPHSDSNWPNSRTRAAAVLSDTCDKEFPKLSWTRARHRRGAAT